MANYDWISNNRILTAIIALLVYQIAKTTYRLFLHPLTKFPGPKLAAATRWYEIYYELIAGGQWTARIAKMHEQYGPIVRINPHELHINDADFYDKLYNFDQQLDKRVYPGVENLQHTPSSSLHKIRRRNLEPFFSRQSVTKLEWLIREGVEKLLDRMREAQRSKGPITVSLLYRSLTSDVISEYAFSHSYSFLDNPDESETFFNTFKNMFRVMFVVRESGVISFLLNSMSKLPSWMVQDKGMQAVAKWQGTVEEQVKVAMSGDTKQANDREHRTIFQEYKDSNLPPADKRPKVVFDNAIMLVGAGFETTGFTLSCAHYHLVANPDKCRQLKKELADAWPATNTMPTWNQLEKVPYLKAVIQEALRMSVGVMSRLPRVNHHATMQYHDWVIPPHTPVGMSQPLIHFDAKIFPEPWKFLPERWLEGEKSKKLEKYLVSFSKGSRVCIGMHLAQAELYLALANVFHHFDMELFETTRKDVDAKFDFFVPSADPDSKGIRVLVK